MTSLQKLRPILKVGSFLGTFPFFNPQTRVLRHSKLYTSSLILAVLSLYIWNVYETLSNNVFEFVPYQLETCGVAFIVKAVYNSRNFTESIFVYFDKIAEVLGRHQKFKGGTRAKFYALCTMTIFVVGFSGWMLRLLDVLWTEIVLTWLIYVYQASVYSIQFELLECCHISLSGVYKTFTSLNCVSNSKSLIETVHNLTRLHWQVCESVYIFNDLFGWLMLIQTAYVCYIVLVTINRVIVLEDIQDNLEISVVVILFLAGVLLFIMGLYLRLMLMSVRMANLFQKLSRKADELWYNFLGTQWLMDSLSTFSSQAGKQPAITATKFFAMDYSLTLPLFALLSTFVIIIVQ